MNEPRNQMPLSHGNTHDPDPKRDTIGMGSQPISHDEIENLLNLARENRTQPMPAAATEELGPGDVQYLRGESVPVGLPSPLMTLQQVESRLNEALSVGRPESAPPATEVNATSFNPHFHSSQGLTLEDLGDVELDITIEFGRTELLIDDILKLREGSVVSLDKLAGDPVDIMANGRLVARGELLVVDGKFGVRLSEVL